MAEVGEGVVDSGWDDGVDGAGDEAIAFEAAQGDGEHALADAIDGVAEFGESAGSVAEEMDDEQGPFVADAVEDVADGAVVVGDWLFGQRGGVGHGSFGVPEAR